MRTALALTAALLLFIPQAAFAQAPGQESEALKREIEALKQAFQAHQAAHEGQDAILKELQEIKNLLRESLARPAQAPQPPSPPETVVLGVDGHPFKGQKNAKVTLIEFSDYQCPFCARHFRETLPQIEKEYIQTGRVKYVLRDFPIESIHPQVFKGHEAVHCAGEQGKHWEMHGRLFNNQKEMSPNDLSGHAKSLGLSTAKFQQCLDSGKYAAKVRKNLSDGRVAGVTGTPTFFLGLTEANSSQIKSLSRIVGAQPYAAFKEAIESLLSAGK